MPIKQHRKDQTIGPKSGEGEAEGENLPDGQPMPEDQVESDGEKQARDVERGFDRALNRIPPG